MRISDWSSDVCSSDLNYFVAQKYIEAFKALAEAPNQKFVMMPMESAGVIGSLAGIRELAKDTFGQQAGRAVQPPAMPRPGSVTAIRLDVFTWAAVWLPPVWFEPDGPGWVMPLV